MRDYGKVHSSFWSSETIRSLSDDARHLALYLLTCSHSTIIGAFRLPDGYVCEDMGWESGRVQKGFSELLRNGFANRCETTKWVFVCKHFDWNTPENPNQWKAAKKMAAQIPANCTWLPDFKKLFSVLSGEPLPSSGNPSETLSKPVAVTGAVTETGTGDSGAGAPPPDPKKKKPKGKKITLAEYIEQQTLAKEKLIPEDHAVLRYAQQVGIPNDFLHLAWDKFKSRYTSGDSAQKKYIDWPAVFDNAVRDNWMKVWFIEAGIYKLTTVGQQAELARKSHVQH